MELRFAPVVAMRNRKIRKLIDRLGVRDAEKHLRANEHMSQREAKIAISVAKQMN